MTSKGRCSALVARRSFDIWKISGAHWISDVDLRRKYPEHGM